MLTHGWVHYRKSGCERRAGATSDANKIVLRLGEGPLSPPASAILAGR
jgi:hypothetical protein